MTEPAPRKSDLGVRVVSAVVMVSVAGTALWLGGDWWTAFVVVVALVCLGEFLRLIFMATSNPVVRFFSCVGAVFYVSLSAFTLAEEPYSWTDDVGGRLGLVSVLFVVGVVVCTDIGAYFVGRTVGGPKIAPQISPSKTWAGLFGGMVAAAVWSLISLKMLLVAGKMELLVEGFALAKILVWAAASGAILAVVAQSGDFFESWLKRRAGVKDSSNLIPGHGGIFDRIDGLLPVVLVSAIFHVRPF